MLATAKHFPGHGDTATDSHIGLPVLDVDRAARRLVELPPFRAAIEAGVAGVMVAHIAFPALTGDSVPATLSPRLIQGLLQARSSASRASSWPMPCAWAVIVAATATRRPRCARCEAGADVLLMPLDIRTAIDAVVAAVERGRISAARIDRSVRKLLRLRRGCGLHERRTVDLDRVPHDGRARGAPRRRRRIAERLVHGRSATATARPAPRRSACAARSASSTRTTPTRSPAACSSGGSRRLPPGMRGGAHDAAYHTVRSSIRSSRRRTARTSSCSRRSSACWREGATSAIPAACRGVRRAGRRSGGRRSSPSFGNPYVLSQFPTSARTLLAWGPRTCPSRRRPCAR